MLEGILGQLNWTTCIILLIVAWLWTLVPKRRKGIPHGPPVFPIFGNIPSLISRDPLDAFTALRNKYGDLYGLFVGQEFTVIINGYDAIHEALVKKGDIFAKRPRSEFHQLMFKDPGIVFANGEAWRQNRKFTQMALNEFGYGWTEKTMEERINEEVIHFIQEVEQQTEAFNIGEIVNLSVANVISGILFGQRSDYKDPQFVACLNSVGEAAELFTRSSLLMSCFPILKKFPGDFLGLKKIEEVREKPKTFLKSVCSRHAESYDELKERRNVMDLYRREISSKKDNVDGNIFNETHMRVLMGELLSAGSETTATCVIWIILYLIKDVSLQKRLQADIDDVIGTERQPTLNDRKRLAYVEATILEGLRIAPVAPLSVPHAVHEDTMFRGFLIPKETTVLVNLHSVLKDPATWDEPESFRPERFLDNTDNITIPKEFIPYSAGRRACLGESLARMELFLYITALLQKFDIAPENPESLENIKGNLGMTYSPSPFKVKLTPRR
ncbi:Cytochrome P450 2J2 [Mactra antiquata]